MSEDGSSDDAENSGVGYRQPPRATRGLPRSAMAVPAPAMEGTMYRFINVPIGNIRPNKRNARTPAAYRLIGNHDPAFSQQVLDIAEAEGEPGLEPDGVS